MRLWPLRNVDANVHHERRRTFVSPEDATLQRLSQTTALRGRACSVGVDLRGAVRHVAPPQEGVPHGVDPHGVGPHRVRPRCDACAIAVRMSPGGSEEGTRQAGQCGAVSCRRRPTRRRYHAGRDIAHSSFRVVTGDWNHNAHLPGCREVSRPRPPLACVNAKPYWASSGTPQKSMQGSQSARCSQSNRQRLVEALVPSTVDLDAMSWLLRKQCRQFGPCHFGGRGPIGKDGVALPETMPGINLALRERATVDGATRSTLGGTARYELSRSTGTPRSSQPIVR